MIGRCVANRAELNLRFQGDTNDHSINNYTVTPFNSPTNANGILGQANGSIDFNGSNQYLTLTSSVNNMIAEKFNSNGSVSVWFNCDNVSKNHTIFSTYANTAENSTNFQIGITSGDTYMSKYNAGSSSTIFYSIPSAATNWIHYVATFNINEGIAYVNSSNVATHTYTNIAKENSTLPLYIGRRAESGQNVNYFNGRISGLVFYDVTLSAGQIKIINNEKGRIRA